MTTAPLDPVLGRETAADRATDVAQAVDADHREDRVEDREAPRSASSIRVVPMRRRHLRSVLRIESANGPGGWSVGLFLAELSRTEGRVYRVAKLGSSVVGFAGLLMVGDEGHVTTIAVDPAHRERRIGTRLVYELVTGARESGADALTLEVRSANTAAIALYRRFGFAPAGVRARYYRDPVEDALIMWAPDVRSAQYSQRLQRIGAMLDGRDRHEGSDG